ncbi:MAG: hypothetical protein KIT79_05905 [Deltaproteobacteria bacterium]|nr:hypothetical protein [Deltaproteobacteria bacterium]
MIPLSNTLRELAVTGCFFCGVDSTPILIFFLTLVGSGLAGAALLLLWSVSNGDFRHSEAPKYDLFIQERKQ